MNNLKGDFKKFFQYFKDALKNIFKEVLLAFSFLSRIPINVKLQPFKEIQVMKKIPRYFPLVGYIPGMIYYLGCNFSKLFGSLSRNLFGNLESVQSVQSVQGVIFVLSSLLPMTIGFYFFDLFHFDGLLDMLDGFLNQSSKERRLEIMSKGNVGPFAVFYGTLYILVFWELMKFSRPIYFIFGSVFGRYTMVVVLNFSKPAKDKGLGAMFFPFSQKQLFDAIVLTVPLLLFQPIAFSISIVAATLTGLLVSYISHKKIDGITGDVLGGSCLIGQIFVLLSLNLLVK